ncbi:MAG: hypothetical protein KBF45_08715 [Cyclobacteriaceae bacterium]|nr:hypothetical protein [Cyclobacteriaceae bacterium]
MPYSIIYTMNSSQVLVFKTTVQSDENISRLTPMLNKLVGDGKWNFDLDDCDRILRIATEGVRPNEAIDLLSNYGFLCQELD